MSLGTSGAPKPPQTLEIADVLPHSFALGPLIWAPLSEHAGRWPSFVIALTCYTGFNVGCALSPNIGALIVFRLLAGSFSACPLTNSAAVLGDIWDANMRGTAMAVFALAPFAGMSLYTLGNLSLSLSIMTARTAGDSPWLLPYAHE